MGGRHKDPEYHKKWWEKNKHKYREPRPHSDPDYQKKYYDSNKDEILEEAGLQDWSSLVIDDRLWKE